MAISVNLWPYAIRNVTEIMNDIPTNESKSSRIELFAKTPVRPNVRHHHHFGVPTYLLDNALQSGFKIGKWLPRARLGIYVGKSPRYSRSVALVLNPRTGNVSPQFHLKYDDTFETVMGKSEESHGMWKEKCGFASMDPSPSRTDPKASPSKIKQNKETKLAGNDQLVDTNETEPLEPVYPDSEQLEGDETYFPMDTDPITEPSAGPTQKSTRSWKPTQRFLENLQQEEISLTMIPHSLGALHYIGDNEPCDEHQISLIAKTDQDTMYWDQAMKQDDAEEFIQAAEEEITTTMTTSTGK
jgi:hypothetical protein